MREIRDKQIKRFGLGWEKTFFFKPLCLFKEKSIGKNSFSFVFGDLFFILELEMIMKGLINSSLSA